MIDPKVIAIIIISIAFIVTSILHGRAASERDKARKELTSLYQQEARRQKRETCPYGSALHIRTAVPNLCLDVPTGTLTTHNSKKYNPVPPERIPSTIRTANWKGL